ncbi:MAG: hypothetical protein WCH04_14790 [Gammaproteobacteria bacterium]
MELTQWAREVGLYRKEMEDRMFPTLRQALKAYRQQMRPAKTPPVND